MMISQDGHCLYALSTSTGYVGETGQPDINVYGMKCDCGLKEVQSIVDGLGSEEMREAEGDIINGVVGLALYSS